MPDRIANAPELLFGLELYFIAYLDLTTCRPFAGAQIPWSAIDQYARSAQLDDEQREDLFYHVQQLDKTFLDFYIKKNEEKVKKVK